MLKEQLAVPWERLCVRELRSLIWEAASRARVSIPTGTCILPLLSNTNLLLRNSTWLANLSVKCGAQAWSACST